MIGLALAKQGPPVVPDRDRRDVHEAHVLEAGLIDLVLGSDDRGGNPIGTARFSAALVPSMSAWAAMDLGTVLEGDLDEVLLVQAGCGQAA